MKKPGRNKPCPCGSGKKYKKCCLHAPQQLAGGTFVYTDLDDLSNQVPRLIEQGKYKEAESVCKQLMKEYPKQIDGIHRYAELFEEKGELLKAAEYYHKTATFAEQAGGFGEESVAFFKKKAIELAGDIGKE